LWYLALGGLIAITLAFGMLSNLMLLPCFINFKQIVNQQTGVYRTKIDVLASLKRDRRFDK
jgi:hypothetical protein